MASIERTAYPRFQSGLTETELDKWYTPTTDEIEFAQIHTRQLSQQVAFVITLKCVQRLGYFTPLAVVPMAVQEFICQALQCSVDALPIIVAHRTRYRYRTLIRTYLKLQPYPGHGESIIDTAVLAAVETMSDPADLINVALAQLHRNQIELPQFSIVDRRVATLRARAHQQLYDRILARLTNTQKTALDTLLTVAESQQVSHFTQLKEAPGKATLKNLRLWEKRLVWVTSLLETKPLLSGVTNTKRKQFAAQAYALELGDIRDIQGHGKRYTLLLCLLHDAQVATYDQLTTMFLHRMRRIHHNAHEKLKQFREAQLAVVEQIVTTLGEIAHATLAIDDNGKLGELVRVTLDSHGGAQQLAQQAELLSVYHDNNYLPLMWESYRSFRAVLFRLADQLSIRSATQDTTVIAALEFLKPYTQSRRKYLPAEIDISFASQRWQQLVKGKYRQNPVFHRKQLEVCIFHYVAVGLNRGDLFVEGSADFADYRRQLMTWEQCEPLVAAYCETVNLPNSADKFVQQLRQGLRDTAERIDAAFPKNSDLSIDNAGQPHLTRTPKRVLPEGLEEFKTRLLAKMPDRHLLDILKFVQYWVHYTNYFGPPSGHIPKMVAASAKYLVTIFGYGCGLGAAQTAKHTRGIVTRRSMKRINDQHISTTKLEAATRDIIDEYARFQLPFMWGDGKHAVADGTHFKLLDNNLLGQHHFRYGEYGVIAYHHVSDTYIALFSHFISCGVWEAVYILDGLLKNDSSIQPNIIHADTQGQSATVFGLSYLLGIQLMPRMRNWNKVILYRPDPESEYKHIDALFSSTINWSLLETHWQDMMQVVLSIQSGKVLPSMLLQKLGSHNRQNKLYKAFAALGRVIRTQFLLEFLSDVEMRQQIHAATTVVERYNGFLDWLSFGGDGVIRVDDPVEQEKRLKYLNLVANAVLLHNVVDMTNALEEMRSEGCTVSKELVARISPYMTSHIKRFGEYFLDMEELPPPLQPDKEFLTSSS